jgi:ribosomal protein L16/L10AE
MGAKGKPKTGGKPKGYTSEAVKASQEIFKSAIEDQFPKMIEAFDKARAKDPIKYLDLITKFAQYVMPKMVDVTTKGEEVKQVFKIGDTEVEL